MNVEELCAEAAHLSAVERGLLVERLLVSFEASAYAVTDQEVTSRVEETRSGQVQDISFEQLLSGVQYSKEF